VTERTWLIPNITEEEIQWVLDNKLQCYSIPPEVNELVSYGQVVKVMTSPRHFFIITANEKEEMWVTLRFPDKMLFIEE
jgi:hypothetical protein